jgi:hypothetical protein
MGVWGLSSTVYSNKHNFDGLIGPSYCSIVSYTFAKTYLPPSKKNFQKLMTYYDKYVDMHFSQSFHSVLQLWPAFIFFSLFLYETLNSKFCVTELCTTNEPLQIHTKYSLPWKQDHNSKKLCSKQLFIWLPLSRNRMAYILVSFYA